MSFQNVRRARGMGRGAAWGLTLALSGGCLAAEDSASRVEGAPTEIEGQTQASYPRLSAAWPNPLAIPVCWDGTGWLDRKAYIRAAVEGQYEGRAEFSVNFTGWGACTPTSRGIRIQISDETPHVVALGKGLDGVPEGMVLNFDFDDWNSAWGWCDWIDEAACSRKVAIHEFGHALGLAHEHNREDRHGGCNDSPQGSDGSLFVGPWDEDSVMNYCNNDWNNDGYLSAGDKAGLARMYGGGGDVVLTGGYMTTGTFLLDQHIHKVHDQFCPAGLECEVGDFNGDGKDDLLALDRFNGDASVTLWKSPHFEGSARWIDDFCTGNATCLVGDLTGDKTADLLKLTRGTAGNAVAALSNGESFIGPRSFGNDMCKDGQTCRLGDVNADGLSDLVIFGHGTGTAGGNVWVAFNGGGGLERPVLVNDNFCFTGQTCMVTDLTKDGRADAVSFDGATGQVRIATAQQWFTGNTSFVYSPLTLDDFCKGNQCGVGHGYLASFTRGREASMTLAFINEGVLKATPWFNGACADHDVCHLVNVLDKPAVVAFTRNAASAANPGPVIATPVKPVLRRLHGDIEASARLLGRSAGAVSSSRKQTLRR